MLPMRDPSQDKRLTQNESEGLETNFPSKQTGKKSRGSNTQIRQNRPQKTAIKRDSEGHFIILKGRIHQEDIVNIYAANIGAPKYVKKILADFKKDLDSNTSIVGDFDTQLSKMVRSSKQNIKKHIVSLKNTLDEIELPIYIERELLIPKKQNTHFFQVYMEFFKDRPHDKTQSKPQQIQEN